MKPGLTPKQGDVLLDGDPNSENRLLGATPNTGDGGSLIFLETIRETLTLTPTFKEQITVVHELGHAVGRNDAEPVTDSDANNTSGVVHYTTNYIHYIRSTIRPEP